MEFDQMVKRMRAELEILVKETGASLKSTAADVAAYTAQRAEHLAKSVGEPGFDQALKAESQNLMLFAAIRAVDEADAADVRLQSVLSTGLRLMTQVAIAAL